MVPTTDMFMIAIVHVNGKHFVAWVQGEFDP